MNPASTQKRLPAFLGHSTPLLAEKTRATGEAGTKECHSYKPLPSRFRHDRFDYRQIHRKGDFAIYQQTWRGKQDSAAFEVIRVRRRDGFEINGRFVQPAEIYPNCEAWGVDGFTLTDKDAAFAKLREISR
jgi:hypothetical protein